MLRMRILLILPALLFASCGTRTRAFTEGPAQGPDGLIYFSDIANNGILRFDPKTRKHEVFRADSNRANGLLFDDDGRLIACEGSDLERKCPATNAHRHEDGRGGGARGSIRGKAAQRTE